MTATDVLRSLPGLVAVAGVGRIALSLLPPGTLGAHAPRAWPTTWAASHTLGWVALGATGHWLALLGGTQNAVALLAPWVIIGLVRWTSLPGALRPRYTPPRERPGRSAALALAILIAVATLPFVRSSPALASAPAAAAESINGPRGLASNVLGGTHLAALIVLLGHGLEQARRAPAGRRWVLLLLLLTPAIQEGAVRASPACTAALLWGAGCAALIPWLRRGDRRAVGFAALCFAGLTGCASDGWTFLLAGCALILVSTAAPARPKARVACGIGLLLVALPAWLARPRGTQASLLDGGALLAQLGELLIDLRAWGVAGWLMLVGFALAAARLREVRRRATDGNVQESPGIDAPGRELAAVLFAALLAIGAAAALAARARLSGEIDVRWMLATCALTSAGLAAVRPERVAA